jgi:hypothetical protein
VKGWRQMKAKDDEKLQYVTQLASWCRSRGVEVKIAWFKRQWRVGIRQRGRNFSEYFFGDKGDDRPASLVKLLDHVITVYNSRSTCSHDPPQQPGAG